MIFKAHFSKQEYADRLAKTRQAMVVQAVDWMIISDPSNMAWLTGYEGWSFYVHQCVLLRLDGEPLWYGRAQDAAGASRTCWMSDDCLIAYPDYYVQSTHCHPMDYLADIIRANNGGSQRIGVEMDNYWFSAAAFAALQTHLPQAKFSDVTGLVNWQRAVKSEQEIHYMRIAAFFVERIFSRIVEKVEPGVRQCDLVAEIYDAALRYDDTIGAGGDYPSIVPLLPSGEDAAAPHLTWNDQPLRRGEGTFFEVAGVYRRYHCPLARTVFLGKPPAHFLHAEQVVGEGLAAGLAVAKAGNRCEDVANAFFAVLKKYGISKDSRVGYSIGLSYPPDWGERTMSLRSGDQHILEENMTFHFMTSLWMETWGFEMTESILIGSTGAECLAQVPRQLFIKD